jgi:hypothetical protein
MATRKPRRFGEGGGVREGQNANIDDDTRARAMKWVQQQQEGKSDSEATPKSAPKPAPKAAPKPTPKAEAAPVKKASAADIPNSAPKGWKGGEGEKVDSTELGRNINNALNATPGIQAVGRIAGAGKAAKSGSRALAEAGDTLTFLGKSGRRQVGGFDEIASRGAKELANNPTRQLAAPPKQITGPSKADLVSRDRSARAAARKEAMNEENAARHGLNRKDPDFAEKASEVRQNLGGDEWSLGMKRGGKVKAKAAPEKAYKAGGSVKGWGIARGARKAKLV